jgi:riboflavin synthase alpha subunit
VKPRSENGRALLTLEPSEAKEVAMFRGFITEIGEVVSVRTGGIAVAAPKACAALAPGGSVAVAGTCLSAEAVEDGSFRASLSEETRRRATLGSLRVGAQVNVELPLRAGDAIEGHFVQGHVDAIGKVVRVEEHAGGPRVWIRPPERLLEALVAKGSVAVDGVSLTVAEVVRDRFSVALVPATLERTTLGALREGDRVNLESDLVDRLARRFEGRTHEALRRVVAAMPWAGVQNGRLGVEKVVAQIAAGGCVLVFDPEREGEGDVVSAGVELRPATFAFILTQCCSHPTVPCDRARLDRLEIPPMPGAGDHRGRPCTSPWTSPRRAARASRPRNARPRCAGSRTRRRGPRTSSVPATSSRWVRVRAGCASGRGTPRPPWSCVGRRSFPR